MKKVSLNLLVIIVLVAAGVSFYGGTKYSAGGNNAVKSSQNQGGNGDGGFRGRNGGGQGNNVVAGDILAKDDKSVTVKMRDGGSKIVFFSDSTEVMKSVKGTRDDLEVGKTLMSIGKPNPDGSFTAYSIQLRTLPMMPRTP